MSQESPIKLRKRPTLHRAWSSQALILLALGTAVANSAFALRAANAEESDVSPTETAGAPAAVPAKRKASPTPEKIDAWIEQLGDDEYAIRRSASERLLEAGMPAREPLLKIVDGPDPETRAAARRLVALIDRTEFQRRLRAFAADVDGSQGLTLPGWEKYREFVGDDAAARELFVEMQRQEAAMLSAVFGVSSQSANEIWEQRMQRLVQWPATSGSQNAAPPLGSCAAMVFLGTAGETESSDRGAMLVDLLLQRPPLREAMQDDNDRNAIRRLAASWVLHCPNPSDMVLQRRLSAASRHNFSEALPLALDIAGGDPQYLRAQPQTRAAAILLVGQLGKREHAERLEPMLEDAAVCFAPGGVQAAGDGPNLVQVRDVALVVMLHLTDQRPPDYGYVHARMQSSGLFQLPTLFLANDEQRAAAIDKWKNWKAEQTKNGD
jgi:HEAT repeat protein